MHSLVKIVKKGTLVKAVLNAESEILFTRKLLSDFYYYLSVNYEKYFNIIKDKIVKEVNLDEKYEKSSDKILLIQSIFSKLIQVNKPILIFKGKESPLSNIIKIPVDLCNVYALPIGYYKLMKFHDIFFITPFNIHDILSIFKFSKDTDINTFFTKLISERNVNKIIIHPILLKHNYYDDKILFFKLTINYTYFMIDMFPPIDIDVLVNNLVDEFQGEVVIHRNGIVPEDTFNTYYIRTPQYLIKIKRNEVFKIEKLKVK